MPLKEFEAYQKAQHLKLLDGSLLSLLQDEINQVVFGDLTEKGETFAI